MDKYEELFKDVFSKTDELLQGSIVNEENDQASHIMYYLSLFGCYLKGPAEAACFKQHWFKIKERIKSIADFADYMNQIRMMEDHIEQSLKSESIHHPDSPDNIGIYHFYENQFPSLYQQAKKAKEDFWARQNKRFDYADRLAKDEEFFNQEFERDWRVIFLLDP